MTVPNITAQEAFALTQQTGGALILDVREPWEVALAGIDGAIHIPMGRVPNEMHQLPTNQPILVMCHHGVRSLHVATFLMQQGLTQVMNVQGGCEAWSLQVNPQVPRY